MVSTLFINNHPSKAYASGESVIVPPATTLLANTTNVALSDDFAVMGSSDVMVFVELTPGSSSTLSISATSGLTLEAESAGWINQSALRFHGSVADANTALDSRTISTLLPETTAITVTVTEYDANYHYLPSTGHFYHQTSATRIHFFDALRDVQSQSFKSRPGYLVNITNDAEYNIILSFMGPNDKHWIGLSDDSDEGNWHWMNGPEYGTTTTYTRWCSGQPNGNWLIDQDYVFFSGSARGACWTDLESMSGDIDGYLVEFGDSTPFSGFYSAVIPISVVTPTATPTATATYTATLTPTHTPIPTNTSQPTPTDTYTPSPTTTATVFASLAPSATDTQQSTNTQRPFIASATNTVARSMPTTSSTTTDTPQVVHTSTTTPSVTITPELTTSTLLTDSTVLSGTNQTDGIVTQLLATGIGSTQIKNLLSALSGNALTTTQARMLAAEAKVLQHATAQQATQIFATIDTSTLDEVHEQAIIAAVQQAPTEVRAAFEAQIDLFGDGFNSYIPLGSKIPIEARRALVLTGIATAAVAGSTPRIRRRKQ